jgi:hypothetical protein
MQEYLKSDPILWVHSSTLLRFIRQRLAELRNVQQLLSKIQPSNYATLTCIIMHLIRSVPSNPLEKAGFLRDALVDLQFGPVVERFGMFFIHDFHFSRGFIRGIDLEDSAEAKQIMKHVTRPQPDTIKNSCPTEIFPLGHAPSWAEVSKTMAYDPELLIQPWVWEEGWGMDYTASSAFIKFTVDMWLSVNPSILQGEAPHPTTLQEAMETWTVSSLKSLFSHCTFIPSNYKLHGHINGRRTKGLPDMVDVFFPPEGSQAREDSVWLPFIRSGYIAECNWMLGGGGNRDRAKECLRQHLRIIFEGVQCLPLALPSTKKSRGKIWDVSHGSVRFLTNPIYYRLEEIGPPKKRHRRAGLKVKANAATIEARLAEEHIGIPFNITIKRNRYRRRVEKKLARSKHRTSTIQAQKQVPHALDLESQSTSAPSHSPMSPMHTHPSASPATSERVQRRHSKRIMDRKVQSLFCRELITNTPFAG